MWTLWLLRTAGLLKTTGGEGKKKKEIKTSLRSTEFQKEQEDSEKKFKCGLKIWKHILIHNFGGAFVYFKTSINFNLSN